MNRKIIITSISILLIFSFFVFDLNHGFIPWPIGIRHLANLIILPHDLYKPIILDKFKFHEKGYAKTYYLKPTYLDIYEIGFLLNQKEINSNYNFQGKLRIEFFVKNKFLYDSFITSVDHAWFNKNDMTEYRQVSLYKFDIPLENKYKNEISVKITVLEPDPVLRDFSGSMDLYIAVSAQP